MISVYVHKIKFGTGSHEGIVPDIVLSFSFFSFFSVKYKTKVKKKIMERLTFLHLSDDKKVSESFAQIPAQKFHLTHCRVRSFSQAPFQLVKGSPRA